MPAPCWALLLAVTAVCSSKSNGVPDDGGRVPWRKLFAAMLGDESFKRDEGAGVLPTKPVLLKKFDAAGSISNRFGMGDMQRALQSTGAMDDNAIKVPCRGHEQAQTALVAEDCDLYMLLRPGAQAPECSCVYDWPNFTTEQQGAPRWQQVMALLGDGSTVVHKAAQSHSSELSAAVQEAQAAFGIPTNVNVFATGAAPDAIATSALRSEPFGSFILPMAMASDGQRWEVYSPQDTVPVGVNPIIRGQTSDDALDPVAMGPPLINTTLKAGDVMFIPLGYIYRMVATSSEGSLHLSVNVETHRCEFHSPHTHPYTHTHTHTHAHTSLRHAYYVISSIIVCQLNSS